MPGAEGGRLILLFESPVGDVLDPPDNLVVSPRGGILLCEDDASSKDGATDTHPLAPGSKDVNRLIGLTMAGSALRSPSTPSTTPSSPAPASAPTAGRCS